MLRSSPLLFFCATAVWLLLTACSSPEPPAAGPVVLIGIDGGSWSAIEQLWSSGELQNLKQLAASGVRSELVPVADASPVIWTTMATGMLPERHGITNFVVRTESGEVPVSSSVRKVPAIWNMVSTARRTVAALGWWATWPAEQVSGIVVTDRPFADDDGAIYPEDFVAEFESIAAATADDAAGPQSRIQAQDRAVGLVARGLIDGGFDLMLVYQRNVDAMSHQYWKYFRPQDFAQTDPQELERYRERVPDSYRAVDRLLGDLRATASAETTFFVVSDHGFYSLKRPRRRVTIDLDRVLETMGYLARKGDVTDPSETRALAWDSPPEQRIKLVRIARRQGEPAGAVATDEVQSTRDRLAEDLAQLVYESGRPVFRVRPPRGREIDRGADLTAVVQSDGATPTIAFGGKKLPVVAEVGQEISGSHSQGTEGIFIASGPIIEPTVALDSIHSLDITPTLLVALGLPVARDFDGRARLEIFTERFLHQHPPQSIDSWGQRLPGQAVTSDQDEALIEELKALGYLE